MKKTMMFVLMLLAAMLFMPSVYAETGEYATVEDITNADTLKTGKNGTLTGVGTDEVTLTYSEAAFEIIPKGSVDTRPDNKAFVGIRIKLPVGSKNIKITTQEPHNEDDMETQTTFDKYFGFDANDLSEATENQNGVLKRTYVLTWETADSSPMSQTINIVIKPENVALFNKDEYTEDDTEGKALWNEAKWEEKVPTINVTLVTLVDGKKVETEEENTMPFPVNYVLGEEEKDYLNGVVNDTIKGAKLKFVGFFTDEKLNNKYNWETAESDLTVYMAFETVKEETNPATGDNLLTYIALGAVSLVAVVGSCLYLRKVND